MSEDLIDTSMSLLPSGFAIAITIAVLALANYLLRRNQPGELTVRRQLLLVALTVIGALVVVFVLPISEASRQQVLSVLGLVVTAVIALSSTTFVANVMAGLMLRSVNPFRPGDFVRCGEYFGKVSERGIFHIEIQTADRDLTTLPNLYFLNNAVTVVRSSGTVISAELSLGYDVSHSTADTILKQAAEATDLDDAFVLVVELLDHAVLYRVGGFCEDVSRLLTTKSMLRRNILDEMHKAGVEIASPSIMLQRPLPAEQKLIPKRTRIAVETAIDTADSPESKIFDKADTAGEREKLREELSALQRELEALGKPGEEDPAAQRLLTRITAIKDQLSEEVIDDDDEKDGVSS